MKKGAKLIKYDITGQRFGRLVAVRHVYGNDWVFTCDCGTKEYVTKYGRVRKGVIVSCGCYGTEVRRAAMKTLATTHGKCYTRSYNAWQRAREWCRNVGGKSYKKYGAQGIKFSAAWDNFEDFYKSMGDCPEGMSLDRINPFGDYAPGNCRWTTPKTQAINQQRAIALACLKKMNVDIYQLAVWLGVQDVAAA